MMQINSTDSKALVDWALENESVIKYRDDIQKEKPHSGHKGWENAGYILHLEREEIKLKWEEEYNFPYKHLVSIDNQIRKMYNLSDKLEFAPMGWILMYTENDYVCKWHKDPNVSEGKMHTRFNVMISKPEEGGFPIIRMADKETVIEVKENEPWVCLAGLYEHSTTEIKGNKPRIMLSFGYNIKLDEHRG